MKQPSYDEGIKYIAMNDGPIETLQELMVGTPSIRLLSVLFDVECSVVAADVVRFRVKHGVG